MAHTEAECLHCQINKLVTLHIEHTDRIDVTDLAAKMAESLAELVLFAAPPEEQGKLLAHAIARLGEIILAKSVPREDRTH